MMMKYSRSAGQPARDDEKMRGMRGVPTGTFGAQDAGKPCKCGASDACPTPTTPMADEGLSLAMVYAIPEKYENLYGLSDALTHGTLFADLDKPFHPGFRV